MKPGKLIFMLLIAAAAVTAIILYLGTGANPLADPQEENPHAGSLLINEVMTANSSSVPDPEGEFFDWVELRNTSDQPLDVSSWGLSDNPTRPGKWVFPEATVVPPRGYLVVYCSGENRGGMYASFKLNNQDVLLITDVANAPVDGAQLASVDSGHTFGRNPDRPDEWLEFSAPTPGFSNDDAGAEAYRESMRAPDTGVVINELMASNKTTVADGDGEYSDWIELYNPTDRPVELERFGLSDDIAEPMKWRFPQATIPAGGYLLVFCTNRAGGEGVQTDFALSTFHEWAVLSTPQGQIIDSVEFREQQADQSFGRGADGETFEVFTNPTPGYPNSAAGFDEFQKSRQLARGPVVLSELMLANSRFLQAEDKRYYDWIELYNPTDQPVNLTGYALSDNPKNPAKWKFQDAEIGPEEYLTLLASGNNIADPSEGYMETNFALSSDGEVVFLFNPEHRLIDRLNVRRLRPGMSYGRTGESLLYYDEPTPGEPNRAGTAGFAPAPKLLLEGGLYAGSQSVRVEADPDARTTYTLDGSEPRESSQEVSGPIQIDRTTAVRVRSFVDGLLPSDIETKTYMIDSPHDKRLSIVSLVTDPPNFFDPETGIYVPGSKVPPGAEYPFKGANFWNEWERPVHFEIFGADGALETGQDAIVRIFGAYSRGKDQKGLAVIARGAYGPSRIEYPLFENRPYDSYKSFVLRASGQDSTVSLIRDIVMTSLVDGTTNLDVQAYRQSVVYLNGEYWGIYNIREKVNKHFLQQHHNLSDPENIDLLVGNGTPLVGSDDEYDALLEYVKTHDLSIQENYEYVASQVDIDNYIDYIVCEMYSANTDTGNIKYWREKKPGAKWRWIFYDFCWSMQGPARDSVNYNIREQGTGVGSMFSTALIRGLLRNDGFKDRFVRRFAELLKTVFTSERVLAKLEECEAVIKEEMPREVEKWSDAWEPVGGVRGWERNVAAMKTFAQNRPDYLIYFIRRNLNLSDERARELFGSLGTPPPD